MAAFTHDNAHFVLDYIEGLELANRLPAGDDKFLERIGASSDYTSTLSPRQLISWFVARLNYLTSGQIGRSDDYRNGDGGCFLIPLIVAEGGRPSGLFWFELYSDRILLRGGRDSQARDPIQLLVQAMAAEPDCLETCRVECTDPETRRTWSCGWEAGEFIVC